MEDVFTRKDLDELIETREGPFLSIFMPAVHAGHEVRQNPTRFKNLLTRAERLLAEGEGSAAAPDLLAPLRKLLHDTLFWANQSRGLALFSSPGLTRIYRIPSAFREIVTVADHFHVKPLIGFLRLEQKFYVLALSKKEVRLIECTLQGAVEVNVPDLPKGMDEALRYDDPQNRMLFRTGTSRHEEQRTAAFHAHGVGQETAKDDLFRYFQIVDRSIQQVLQDQKAPLIVAGVDYLLPIYAEANSHPNLLQGIVGSPEGLAPEELKKKAWPMIEEILRKREDRALSEYEEKAVRTPSSTDLPEVVSAAYHGRVDSLFISEDDEVWGRFDGEKNEAVLAEDGPDRYDLLNFAALHTITHGGTVIPVPRPRVPGGASAAALFRY
jgi:hypothetical protein